MKLKFKKRKIKDDLPEVEKPYIYEDEKYHRLRRRLILWGFPIIIALLITLFYSPDLNITFDIRHYKTNTFFMFASMLILSIYFAIVTMIKEGSKWFWLVFINIFFVATVSITLNFESIPLFGPYFAISIVLSAISAPIIYISYNFYNHYREHKRNPNKKCSDELMQKGIQLKKKTPKLKAPKNSDKKRKLITRLSKSKNINPLKFTEPAVYGSIRANLTIWGLPILAVLLILIGTLCEIQDVRTYTTISAMGMGAFLFLISMVRPDCLQFWIIFLMCLVLGTPMIIFPPAFLPEAPMTQITLVSATMFLTAFIYRLKLKPRPQQNHTNNESP